MLIMSELKRKVPSELAGLANFASAQASQELVVIPPPVTDQNFRAYTITIHARQGAEG
jgi:hypothetical protein